jgi:hypothetical protein
MKAAKRTCTILISLGVFVMPMLGQLGRAVIVSHAGSEISVSIARTTPLGTVLEEVCREASAQCLGTSQAMAAMVPAQEVHGDWRHVISILLEGAGFNYIASAPSGASPGMLQIVGAASQGRPEQSEVRSTIAARQPNQTGNAGERTSGEPALSGSPNAAVGPSMESSSEPEATSADAAPLSASGSNPLTSGAGESGYSQPSGAAEQATMGGQPGRLLFSDSYGNPIPASHQNLEFLLFPDSQGNLIPVASQGSASYSLFPDSKGNPIPASNQALPYLLFPDGNGRLIPAQTGGH